MQHNHTGPPQPNISYNNTDAVQSKSAEERCLSQLSCFAVSALMSPTGKETILPLQLFACLNFNEDIMPVEQSLNEVVLTWAKRGRPRATLFKPNENQRQRLRLWLVLAGLRKEKAAIRG